MKNAFRSLGRDSLKQPFWSMTKEEVLAALQTSLEGLPNDEALRRQEIFGSNKIEEKRRMPRLRIIWNQLKSPLIAVLIVAGIVTLFLRDWVDAGVIFAAVLVNTALGFWQENKAETILDQLRSYIRTRARVRRDGSEHDVDAASIVPGDTIRVSQGDRIPADARVLFANAFEVDESIVTGESMPVEKRADPVPADTMLNDRTSMLLSGTLIMHGFADAVVTATGNATEFGRIAALVTGKTEIQTPLQRAVNRFSMLTGLVLAALVAGLFVYGVAAGQPPIDIFLIAVAVAVSAIPEGLPVALTVILAVGVERLAKRKGVVRKLLAAESLGSTTLILTDKTGTLTQAKMSLAGLVPATGVGQDAERKLLSLAILNTDVVIENPEERPSRWRMAGRPLEQTLVREAAERDIGLKREHTEIIDRLPFDSLRKYAAVLANTHGALRLVAFGAPEILLEATTVTEDERAKWQMEIDKRANSGERVLGVISKPATLGEGFGKTLPKTFTFEGLVSFRDPLRPGVKDAIKRIAASGVRTVIVTGDHRGTAEAVARELGLVDGEGAVLTGHELAALQPEEILGRLDRISVFARVSPEQKLMIARLYQQRGETVAVTGDGVNDAPALHQADIGIAVGSGTEVAKSAADLVILDDNFETIVIAIEEGRKILDNIRKVIVYLLSDALDELFLIGGAILMGLPLPISALQILFVNFFSDSFPAIAFAFETRTDTTNRHPRDLRAQLLDPEMKILIMVVGFVSSGLLFILYWLLLRLGFSAEIVRTFIFAAFASYSLLVAFSLRDLSASIFSYNPFSNVPLTIGVLIGLALTLCALYLPFLNRVLSTVPLPPAWLAAVLGIGLLNILGVETVKRFFHGRLSA